MLLEMEDIIREELNVKEVIFRADEEDLVCYKAKANFRVLGKELGKDMKQGAEIIENLEPRQIASLLDGSSLVIEVAGKSIEITKEKVDVRREERTGLKVINDGTLTVALDAEISKNLLDEGYVRDLVRGIQTLRKDSGLAVTDRITLTVHGNDTLRIAFDGFIEFVKAETLAVNTTWTETSDMTEIEAGEETWKVALARH